MEFEQMVLKIVSKLDNISGYKKSIIQTDLGDIVDDIEDALFKLKISEDNIHLQRFEKLKEQSIRTNEAIGLLFLTYLTYTLRNQFTYGKMWPIIANDLMKYDSIRLN